MRTRTAAIVSVGVAVLVFVLLSTPFPQAAVGDPGQRDPQIWGFVYDTAGAFVAGAHVVAIRVGTDVTYSGDSEGGGAYRLRVSSSADFDVAVSKCGYVPYAARIHVFDEPERLDPVLAPGGTPCEPQAIPLLALLGAGAAGGATFVVLRRVSPSGRRGAA